MFGNDDENIDSKHVRYRCNRDHHRQTIDVTTQFRQYYARLMRQPALARYVFDAPMGTFDSDVLAMWMRVNGHMAMPDGVSVDVAEQRTRFAVLTTLCRDEPRMKELMRQLERNCYEIHDSVERNQVRAGIRAACDTLQQQCTRAHDRTFSCQCATCHFHRGQQQHHHRR